MLKIHKPNLSPGAPGTETVTFDGREVVLEVSYVGCVLRLREANGYNDSDFYALVRDRELGKSREVEYATTRGWTYANSATVDATDEVKALYEAEQEALAAKRRAEHAAELAKMPQIHEVVTVVGGRKVAKGTAGEVFWIGKDAIREARSSRYRTGWESILPFRYYPDEWRVGLRLADGTKVFTSAAHILKAT